MAMANLGQVVFSVSSKVVRTLDELTRSTTPRWAIHDRYLQKPKSQFLGPGLDTISFTIKFDARLGTDPRKEAERLVNLAQKGKPVGFAVGGKKMGSYLWKVTGLEQGEQRINRKGEITRIVASVSLEEYAK